MQIDLGIQFGIVEKCPNPFGNHPTVTTMNKDLAKTTIEGFAEVKSKIDPNDRYIKSYPSLLKVSQLLCEKANTKAINEDDAILAIAHMVYGWMPRILGTCHLKTEQINCHRQNLTILDAIYVSCTQAKDFVDGFTRSPINNSWVGLSKALHFINPEVFPIWDSKVAAKFDIKKGSYRSEEQTKQDYMDYIEFCHSSLDLPIVEDKVAWVQKTIFEIAEYEITKIRALESILFMSGKAKS